MVIPMHLPLYFPQQKAPFSKNIMLKMENREQPYFISGEKGKRQLLFLRKVL